MRLLEALAVVIFHRAAVSMGWPSIDSATRINPQALTPDPSRWKTAGLFDGAAGLSLDEARSIAGGLEDALWLSPTPS